jgi:riboflavin synthase
MFTGIVSAVGRIAAVRRDTGNGLRRAPREGKRRSAGGLVLAVRAPYKALRKGESVAVNGVCLTVERLTAGGFTVHVVDTTLTRTLFGEYQRGRRVNLERAVRAADRLGGHLVQGHVDGVAVVVAADRRGDALVYNLRVPRAVRGVAVPQGSIAVDGVSLTINALPGDDLVQISLVPHTRRHTTLGELREGDRVHVEADVLAKYVKALCPSLP